MRINRKRYSWWHWLIGINLFFIGATIVASHKFGRVLGQFNLAHELNIATWWSGTCLLALGLLSYEHYCTKEDETRTAWLALSVLFFGLSWDEIGSIHERIGSFSKLSLFGIAGVAVLLYALFKLFRERETRRSATFITVGFIVLGSVAFQEHLEHLIQWPWYLRGLRSGIEEGTELLGMFLCFLGAAGQKNRGESSYSMAPIIPNPFRMKNLHSLLLGGVVVHVIVSVYVAKYLTDTPPRGNPAIWYPSVLYFLLFTWCYYKSLDEVDGSREKWVLFSICFILFSIGTILIPRSTLISNFYTFSLFQIPVIALLYVIIYGKMTGRQIFLLSLMTAVLLTGYLMVYLGYIGKGLSVEYITSGMYAFVVTKIIIVNHIQGYFQISKEKVRNSDAN